VAQKQNPILLLQVIPLAQVFGFADHLMLFNFALIESGKLKTKDD